MENNVKNDNICVDEEVTVENLDDLFVLTGGNAEETEKLAVEPYSYWKSVFRIFIRKKSAIFSLILIAVLILMAIIVPMIYPAEYLESHLTTLNGREKWQYLPPSLKHLFGCDKLGRDLFVCLFQAVRLSFSLALLISLINAVTGILIGMLWGYFRKLDPIMIEIYNFFNNIPSILFYMLLMSIMLQMDVNTTVSFIVGMTIIGWLGMARTVRNQIIIINDREYNMASKTLGTSPFRIITHNLLPYILPVIITNISLSIPSVISMETSLSYFGVGLNSSSIALGPIMTLGYSTYKNYIWTLAFPVLITSCITISFYLLGLALSDALDPRQHR